MTSQKFNVWFGTMVFTAAMLTGSTALHAQAQNAVGIPVGSTPPAVEIEDLDGNTVSLDRWSGRRPVLLEFWATWCPVCAKLQPEIDAAHERFGDQVEFVVVGVAVNQTKRSVRRHLERHSLTFTVLWDTKGRATRAFKAPTTSYVVILDADGTVAYTGVGADQDLQGALARMLDE